jgi:hypothetical protein
MILYKRVAMGIAVPLLTSGAGAFNNDLRRWKTGFDNEKVRGRRMVLKKRHALLVSALILLPSALFGSLGPRKLSFGVYGGWSLGLGYEFSWHSRPSRSDDYALGFHLGVYAQLNLSQVVAIQINGNYQRGTNDWTFTYPGFPYDEGSDPFSIISANLNGVLTPFRLKKMLFYLLGGGGISSGDFEELSGAYFNLTAGLGVKIAFSEMGTGPSLSLGGCFIHLIDPDSYGSDTADYLRFQIGLEY